MNCFPRLIVHASILAACAAGSAAAITAVAGPRPPVYGLNYTLRLAPDEARAYLRVEVSQSTALLREIAFRNNPRMAEVSGDGKVYRDGDTWHWLPPTSGGVLDWRVDVNHRRRSAGYDALLTADWGLFRAEDVIPRAASRTLRGAVSRTTMRIVAPRGWSVVSPYFERDGRFRVSDPERRFDQPRGWIVAGELGVRRETIAGVHVAVAGPVGHSVRRMDILALLSWTLPELERMLPDLPERLTVVSAGDPLWRGGLSAPQSLFLHADRPLISENATSTLLHEVLHIALGIGGRNGYDWILEGLAEYYSLELLYRSGTISHSRYRQARASLEEWSRDAGDLCRAVSSGPTTALAVTVFARLDGEIRDRSEGTRGLDDLTRALRLEDAPVDVETMTTLAEDIVGAPLETLRLDKLPGCAIPESSKVAG